MTIGIVIIPYSFTNNTEVADAVKVNSNFTVLAGVTNEIIAALVPANGSQASLDDRLNMSLNPDGTIKPEALPVGTYDVRSKRIVDADADILNSDSLIKVDTTGGDITLTFPPHASATVMPLIQNIGETGYSVILVGDGTDTVMGLEEYVLSQYGEFAQFDLTGTNWLRIR